jgi:hypothetical protein
MNPKISDFGMARLFVLNQTQGKQVELWEPSKYRNTQEILT